MSRATRYVVVCLLLTASLLTLSSLASASPLSRVDQRFADGLWSVTFTTPEGRVWLYLPARLLPGDTVSGTIEVEPFGEGEAVQRNFEALRAYSLRFDDEEISARGKSVRWRLPESQASSRVELVDGAGQKVAEAFANFVLEDSTPRQLAAEFKAGHAFAVPALAQRGRTILVHGPFDGDFATTRLVLAGKPAEMIAESSELLVVRNPAQALGRVKGVLVEKGQRQRLALNNFDIRIETPKGVARPGASMPVAFSVEGLKGIDREYPLVIYNRNQGVAEFKEAIGESQISRMIGPKALGTDGAFRTEIPFTVKSDGELEVEVEIIIIIIHVPNVTWPPHVPNVTYTPYHATNVTWPPHTPNVTWPSYHAANVTFPPHLANVTFPPAHNVNVSWPPHLTNTSLWVFLVQEDFEEGPR